MLAFIGKWFRVVLGCLVVASPIVAIVILIEHSEAGYAEALFDFRPRRPGRMIADGPLTYGASAAIVLATLKIIRRTRT